MRRSFPLLLSLRIDFVVYQIILLNVILLLPVCCLPSDLAAVDKSDSTMSRNHNNHDHDDTVTTITIKNILSAVQEWQQDFIDTEESASRPFITAAFAQSLDGFMAPYIEQPTTTDNDGTTTITASDTAQQQRHVTPTTTTTTTASNFALSGEESLLMTHALRSIHDGIMVGGNTLSIDNPRLSNRLWYTEEDDVRTTTVYNNRDMTQQRVTSPRPIVLDTNLDHIVQLGRNCRLHRPIICCSEEVAASNLQELHSLEIISADVLLCPTTNDGKLDIHYVLRALRSQFGICSIMVEGGPMVLSSFFAQNLVDAICVTIAPKILLSGVAPVYVDRTVASKSSKSPIDLSLTSSGRFILLGDDAVLLSRFRKRSSPFGK